MTLDPLHFADGDGNGNGNGDGNGRGDGLAGQPTASSSPSPPPIEVLRKLAVEHTAMSASVDSMQKQLAAERERRSVMEAGFFEAARDSSSVSELQRTELVALRKERGGLLEKLQAMTAKVNRLEVAEKTSQILIATLQHEISERSEEAQAYHAAARTTEVSEGYCIAARHAAKATPPSASPACSWHWRVRPNDVVLRRYFCRALFRKPLGRRRPSSRRRRSSCSSSRCGPQPQRPS